MRMAHVLQRVLGLVPLLRVPVQAALQEVDEERVGALDGRHQIL